MILIIGLLIFFLIAVVFSFPQFSPIPYFPSNKKDLKLIVKSLQLKNKQVVIDLGAGDGMVIFEAAKKAYEKQLSTKFVAVDINPFLLFIMQIRFFFHPNKKNIKIIYGDMFTMNFTSLARKPVNSLTFYLYISPWYIDKVISNLKFQISNFRVVSYMYNVKSLSKIERRITGIKHNIYRYTV